MKKYEKERAIQKFAKEVALKFCIMFTCSTAVLTGIFYLSLYGYCLVRVMENMSAPVAYAKAKIAPPAPKPPLTFIDVTRPPILAKIAQAESQDRQFKKDGTVVTNVNKDGTVDVGRYQINLYYHEKTAKKLGYDLFTDYGNEQYAIYLIKNYGTLPWRSSEVRWSKL